MMLSHASGYTGRICSKKWKDYKKPFTFNGSCVKYRSLKYRSVKHCLIFAPVAQLDRASDYGSEGYRFDSYQARFFLPAREPASLFIRICAMDDEFKFHEMMMREALKLARRAADADEVPVGAVIVHGKEIIARAHNQVETLKDPTAHAEMIAITQATNYLSSKWLQECVLYVTIEPCSMCAGALVLSRIDKVVFGAPDLKTGACGSVIDILDHKTLNHQVAVERGILANECGALMSEFFRKKRKKI
jgi:tRNA(adenine34) deaminase